MNFIEATVIRENGQSEKVFIEDTEQKKSAKIREHLTICYTVIGIVALSLTAYVSYLSLKRMNNQ